MPRLFPSVSLAAVIAAASMLVGCGEHEGRTTSNVSATMVPLTEQEKSLILAFVNDAATTVELLDITVGLESRAAEQIIVHRNGMDCIYPSADDNLFDTIDELDGVPYVGPAALQKLLDYVSAQPSGGETVEGVVFSADEAAAVVWGVNRATVQELDVDVGLTSTAAQNLVANAPYENVAAIGAVSYVGPSALTALRSYAPVWAAQMGQGTGGTYDGVTFSDAEAATALEIVNTASAEQLTAGGVSTTPRNVILDNRPWASLAALADFSGIGTATMQAVKNMVPGWTGPTVPPVEVTLAQLLAAASSQGIASPYFGQRVTVARSIITSTPQSYAGGSKAFFAADPPEGNVQQLKIYVAASASQDVSFATLFDDVSVTGTFTQYSSSWEILVDDAQQHLVALNRSGVAYGEYRTCQDAWSSTVGNPEGVVRIATTGGYTYMVPLPLFTDHPMYEGLPDPLDPSAVYGGNSNPGQLWCGDQQAILDAWLAQQ